MNVNKWDILYSYTYKGCRLLRAIYQVVDADPDDDYCYMKTINKFGHKNLYDYRQMQKKDINKIVDWRNSYDEIWGVLTYDDVNAFIGGAVKFYENDKVKCIENHDECGRLNCIININQLNGYRDKDFYGIWT